jgi:hypothetical protein
MFKRPLFFALLVCFGFTGFAYAQDTAQRTADLLAKLDKTKYKKKDKGNFSMEVYVDVRNEAVVRQDRSEYSGTYQADGYRLELTVDSSGNASGSGFDSMIDRSGQSNFTLRGARVEGALLTATKVYSSGESVPFEAVFATRTTKAGTNPEVVKTTVNQSGLGFIQSTSNSTNRVFLDKH